MAVGQIQVEGVVALKEAGVAGGRRGVDVVAEHKVEAAGEDVVRVELEAEDVAPFSIFSSLPSMLSLTSIIGIMSNAAFSILLTGLIVGFGIGKWRTGTPPTVASALPAQVIQAPPPQAPLPPRGGGCGLR